MRKKLHVKATVALDREQVKRVFEEAESTIDYVVGLYKLALPEGIEWDLIQLIDTWPRVNKTTGLELMRMVRDTGKRLHETFPGCVWMNNGFSSSEGSAEEALPEWTVSWDTDIDYSLEPER